MNAPPEFPRRPRPLRSLVIALATLAVDAALLALGLGGVRAVFRDPRALSLLAVWGASGLTLAVLRPVGAQDMVRREVDALRMLGLFLIPLATPAVGAFGARLGRWLLPGAPIVAWAGVALVAAGLAVRLAAMMQLGSRFSPLVGVQREHALERHGLYALVRHPGYAGALVANLGSALAFGSALALPLVLVFALLLFARIRDEERVLREHFGSAWEAYARGTGAMFPRPGSRG